MRTLLLGTLLLACDPKEADTSNSDLPVDYGESDTDTDADADTDTDTDADADTDTDTYAERDNDDDGYSIVDGDCDDEDASINPAAHDGCGGGDEDCDGIEDDDFSGDTYEGDEYSLGDLSDDGVASVDAYVLDGSTDTYTFYTYDGWLDSFEVEISITGPDGVDVAMTLSRIEDGETVRLAQVNDASTDDGEVYLFEGAAGADDTGTYIIEVYSVDGSWSCTDGYTLRVQG